MTQKWLWMTIAALALCAGWASAETVYSDGWVPPRLVDGVWVTSGISDEEAQEYIERYQPQAPPAPVTLRWYRPSRPVGMLNMAYADQYNAWLARDIIRRHPLPEGVEIVPSGIFPVGPRRFFPSPETPMDRVRRWRDQLQRQIDGPPKYPDWVLTE